MPILRMRNAIDRKLQQYQEVSEVYSAFIGDANGNIYPDPNNQNVIFIRYIDGELGSCFNQRVPNVWNWPVRVGFDPNMPRVLQVLGTRDVGYNLVDNLPNVPPQLASLMQWPGPMTLYTRGEQILPALAAGNNGLSLTIFPFFFPLSTGLWGFFPPNADGTPQTYDLTARIPASGATAFLISIQDNGVLIATHGKSQTTPELITSADFPAEPDLTYHPLCAVRLYSGQTVIRQEKYYTDIFDLRWVSRWSPLTNTIIYFFQDTASDIATYKKMLVTTFSPKTTLPFAGLSAGNTVLQNWASDPSNPNLTSIPAGQFTVHVHASKPGGTETAQVYAEVWEVNASGVDIAKIGTTEQTTPLLGTEYEYDMTFFLASPYTMTGVTSRIVARVFAAVSGGGSAPTVDLFYGGTADARLTMPTINSGGGGGLPVETPYRILIADASGNITTDVNFATRGDGSKSPVFGAFDPAQGGDGLVHSTGDGSGVAGRFVGWYLGTTNQPGQTGIRGRGTPASPASVQTGDILEVLRAAGFGVTDSPSPGDVGYALPAEVSSSALWSRGELRCVTTENHDTVSKRGVKWELWAIPNGSTTKQLIATFTATGIDIPTGSIYSINGSNFLSTSTPAAIGTAAAGSAVTASHSDHVHATGAGTPSTQAFGDAAAVGTGPAAAMTDHKHGMPASPTLPKSTGHLFGLTMANNSTNKIDIAVGNCRNLADTDDLTLGSTLTKDLASAWAVGSGNGGLDTGSVGNNTYHIWLIKRTDTGVVDALFSLSATAPTMPTNYDQKRRIGSIIRAAGAILTFFQIDNQFWWKTDEGNRTDLNGGTATTGTLITLTIPTGVKFEAILDVLDGAPVGGGGVRVYDPDIGVTVDLIAFRTSIAGNLGARVRSYTNTSAQIRYWVTSGVTAYIYTQGWIDNRGRLS